MFPCINVMNRRLEILYRRLNINQAILFPSRLFRLEVNNMWRCRFYFSWMKLTSGCYAGSWTESKDVLRYVCDVVGLEDNVSRKLLCQDAWKATITFPIISWVRQVVKCVIDLHRLSLWNSENHDCHRNYILKWAYRGRVRTSKDNKVDDRLLMCVLVL